MSIEDSPALPGPGDTMSLEAGNQPRKSYRRKYRKTMVKFEERMRESTGLFKDEQRIFDISQRLAEQTDQILELLLELNQSPEVPPSLRYDLEPAGSENQISLERHQNEQAVHESLRLGRYQIQKGEKTTQIYQEGRKDLLDVAELAPSRSYASLSSISSAVPVSHDATLDPSLPVAAGYLTLRQEEQYLQNLDLFITGKSNHPRLHALNTLGSRSVEPSVNRERETQLRNPVSVYNWLRKHQPQVFLQDHEASNDKGSKISGSRSSKRTGVGKDVKQEQDYYDEDGIALDYGSVPRGKRKRNDDGAFRPKGGKPGLAAKKRKEDTGKRSKRPSLDARTS